MSRCIYYMIKVIFKLMEGIHCTISAISINSLHYATYIQLQIENWTLYKLE